MRWVQAIAVAFGISMIGFAAFWARFKYRVRRSGQVIDIDANAVLTIRTWSYLAIGVCFILAAVFRSQLVFWFGIGAMLTKVIVEEWLSRRGRRNAGRGIPPAE